MIEEVVETVQLFLLAWVTQFAPQFDSFVY